MSKPLTRALIRSLEDISVIISILETLTDYGIKIGFGFQRATGEVMTHKQRQRYNDYFSIIFILIFD